MFFIVFSVQMEDTSSSFSDPGSESEEQSIKTKKPSKTDQNKKKHSNDKGRHNVAPIQATNTMTDNERKRKTEDNNLKSAEKKKTKSSKTDSSTRSTQFTDEEIKFILFCFFKAKDEKNTLDDFFVHFSKTTRTKAAVKAKIGKIREDFTKQILGLTDTDMEKMGV